MRWCRAREAADANLVRAPARRCTARRTSSPIPGCADFDGIVTAVYLDAGQVVNVGQKIMTVARPEVREAVIAVPPALAEQLASGADLRHLGRARPRRRKIMAAGVRAVDPAADTATRTRNVYLSLTDPPDVFRLGITVQVTLTKPVAPRVDLPATALLEKDGKTQVWIVDPRRQGRAARRHRRGARGRPHLGDGLAAGTGWSPSACTASRAGQQVKL